MNPTLSSRPPDNLPASIKPRPFSPLQTHYRTENTALSRKPLSLLLSHIIGNGKSRSVILGICLCTAAGIAQAEYMAEGTYHAAVTGSGHSIWNGTGTEQTFNFNQGATLDNPGLGVSPVNVDGKLHINVGHDQTLNLHSTDTYEPVNIGASGELDISDGHLNIRYAPEGNDKSAFMMDGGGKLTINNQSLAIDTASEAGFNVQEAATVSVKNSGDFSVTNVLRGIGLQTRNAGTSPQMTVESENIGIDASVAKGGAVYLLAYHVPGTHTDLSLTARETVHLNGDSYGTYTYGNNTLDIAGKNVDIGGNKYGMYAAGTDAMHDNTVTVTANDTLAVNGVSGGLYNKQGNLSLHGKNVNITASNGHGIWSVQKDSATSSATTVKGDETIFVQGTGYDAVYSNDATVGLESPTINIKADQYGMRVDGANGQLTASGTTVSVVSKNSSLIASDNGTLHVNADTVSLTSDMEAVWAEGGTVNISGKNIRIAGDTDSATVYAGSSGQAKINTSSGGTFTMTGNLYAEDNGAITLSLPTAQSVLTGWAIDSETGNVNDTVTRSAPVSGRIDLTMNGGTWNMMEKQGSSNRISSLTADGGTVNMRYSTAQPFSDLYIRNLSGNNALFMVDTDIENDQSDRIIMETATGAHKIDVRATGAEPSREAMSNFIVRQDSGNATFSLANPGQKVDAGVWFYKLANRNSSDTSGAQEWFLQRTNERTPTTDSVLGLSGVAGSYAMWYGQLSDLRERLGEIRNRNGSDGIWARTFAERDKLDGLAGTDFSQHLYGISAGVDHLYKHDANNEWLFGLRGQYTSASQDMDGQYGGSGNAHSYGLAAYATWKHASGWYADTVVTWDQFRQDIDTRMTDGTPVSGKFRTHGAGLSLETGKYIPFGNDLFIEPQAQLAYYKIQGADFAMSNGMQVRHDNVDSLTGRLGLVFGRKWTDRQNRFAQPYLKAGVIHEFRGDQKANVNNETFTDSLKGTRVYYGAGIDWQFSRMARLYGEIERENGDHVSRPWSVSAGLRFEF
ncbi:autotransporter outer membrane beta-barrel domain-containing protein [Oxalobacter formigenes]|nr:autotransporter outer membrane beta-barrel domain-containing protein [Oxalobacter formigenes]ARQ46535.1 Pertactin autotransporter [Oxalobacter formigenes]MCZ4061749.1 autotransporter outer membrane beta-barrel domain-containing protein [Oxalobacter formigenes]QDX32794.1 autotransporter outer membrane beta-barrel domain-containing protein [Oxalobacter formigenes]WAW01030.1 autotransporter outer membrane beta-barrel domain-containing protein [Oxalobacter formigenes]WAW03359.1 autotransporter 